MQRGLYFSSCVVCAACVSMGDVAVPETTPPGATAAPAPPTPTWFRDVEPIMQVSCAGCHVLKGTAGFPLDRVTTTLLAPLVARVVSARDMPPWPPGRAGAEIASSRALEDSEIATIAAWVAAGTPDGDPRDHVDRLPRVSPSPSRPPDLRLGIGEGVSYRDRGSLFVTDEIRCFVLDVPAAQAAPAFVTAARWHAQIALGVHQIGGVAVDAEGARRARARSGLDGRAGFECGGGLDELGPALPLGANGTGGAGDGASMLPAGTAVVIPAGGAVVMRVHYAVKHLGGLADSSSVELWLASEAERASTRPLVLAAVSAPVEVPCPAGVSVDPSNACSRENAFARLALGAASEAKARADSLLASCGTTLDALTARAFSAPAAPTGDHFLVDTSCGAAAPVTGTIRLVRARMQTRGASVRVEAERADGSMTTVLDIPRWRWGFESAYVLAQGVTIEAGRRLRVSCTFDNGAAWQWSALTGEPGHDGPARPPLLPPGYLIAAPHRAAEACTAYVGIEPSR